MRFRVIVFLAAGALAALPGCGSSDDASSGAVSAGGKEAPSVQGSGSEACPPDWPGPWTACPEAAWVRQVAEKAGYRVVDDTGSALVAEGRGRSFSIWVTEVAEPLSSIAESEWQALGSHEGTRVYGDRDLWRWWLAQRFVFWLQAGPFEDSEVPDVDGLGSLIRVSNELPPPP